MLTIDPRMLNLPYQYILENAPQTRTLSDLFVAETQTIASCPTIFEYDVTLQDDSALPFFGFIISYDISTRTISAQSSDRAFLAQSPI